MPLGSVNHWSLIPEYGDPHDPQIRARYGYLEGIVSIIGNLLLFVMKLFLGLFINSIALIADAFHTLSDVATSAVVVIGFNIAKKPSDVQHPFGYGRVEYIATLVIAVLLFVTGFEFIVQSVDRIRNAVSITHGQYALMIGILVIFSALVKELMARFSLALAKKINSDILVADAWHHRSDAFASVAVGISIIVASSGFYLIDPLFGIIVSFIIIYVSVNLVKTSSRFLIGQSPDATFTKSIEDIGKTVRGVKGIHDISLHDYGTNKVITLHAEVDNELPLDEAHAIADILEQKIKEKTTYSTIIHIEPKNLVSETLKKRRLIEAVLNKQRAVVSYHNIQVIRRREKDDITMHLVVNKSMPVQATHDLCHRIQAMLQRTYGSCDVHIHLEPCRVQDCSICLLPCTSRGK